MGLLDRFKSGSRKVASVGSATGSSGEQKSRPSKAFNADTLGCEIREAVEAGDLARAVSLRIDRDHAQFGSSMALAQPLMVPTESVLNEISGLDDQRLSELREGLVLGAVLGDTEFQTRAVLSTVVGQALAWPRFKQEQQVFKAAGFTPMMWDDVLIEQVSPPQAEGKLQIVASLSADARALLGLNALLARRMTASRDDLGARALFTPARTLVALEELAPHGLADQAPTLEDRLSQATAPELAKLGVPYGVKNGRRKSETISRLLAGIPEADVWTWIESTNRAWAADDLVTIGLLGRSETVKWYTAFARLFAHSFQFQLYTDRDEADLTTMGYSGWDVLKTDDCPVCRRAPKRVMASEAERLPPFHLGCRCDVVPILEDPRSGRPWLPPRRLS
jgi:hypothetical protein